MTFLDPSGGGEIEDTKAAKRLKKAERLSENRSLEPWERYRALNDLLDTYIDMVEIADRKARFALIVLGALNALNLVFVTRFTGLTATSRLIGVYAGIYIAISLFLLTRTINVLRPRAGVFLRGQSEVDSPRVRFIGDVMRQSDDQYYESWQRIEVGQLNQELSNHVRNIAGINVEKYRSLDHVYHGLVALSVLTGILITAIILIRLQLF